MARLKDDSFGQAKVLVRKWFSTRAIDEQALIEATWLEQDYWHKHEIATANGIAKAFNGK